MESKIFLWLVLPSHLYYKVFREIKNGAKIPLARGEHLAWLHKSRQLADLAFT